MIKIDGHTKTLGLIGCPVEHTMSPVIHNELAHIYGHNLVYLPYRVDEELGAAVKGAAVLGFAGMNVTVPYKTEVIQYVKEIDEFAEKIGAVNTLVPMAGGWKAYNTDIPGLYRGMLSDGISLEGKEIIILGAGGAARSVAVLAMEKGASRIYIMNRTIYKAEAIVKEINAMAGKNLSEALELSEYTKLAGKKYLCIQATSVGLYPNVEEVVIQEDDFYELVHTGYDLIYNPYETKFMSMVKKHGGKAYNGLKMLLYQGIIAYELWNHITVTEEVAAQVLDKLKKAMGI